MFPFDMDEEDEVDMTELTEGEDEKEPAPEYEIDFDTMTLTGRTITGIAAVKQWIKICLGIPRYEHTQYSWAYGQEFEDMLGRGYTEKELKPILERMVKEALTMNEDITSCHDFKITKESDKVTILFMVDTIYGTTDMEVDYNV
jgi:hypothetical protein